MKKLFVLILLLLSNFIFAQAERITIPESWYSENPSFINQGEQEDFWSWKFYQKEYKFQKMDRYPQSIITIKDDVFYIGKTSSLQCESCSNQLREVFLKGIFYPRLIGMDHISISAFEELKFLSTSPKIRRFRFWLWYPNSMNPQVYLFEIQNENAKKATSFSEFLKDANVTFVKAGWIII